jgi:hypothetical protein
MLAQFYGSPTGQSIMQKMPVYMAEVMPTIQNQIRQVIITHLQRMQQGAAPASATPQPPSGK